MHTNIDYKGLDAREAVLDLVQWFGPRNARLFARFASRGDASPKRFREFVMLAGFAGASGFPVTTAWRRWTKSEITDAHWDALELTITKEA